MSPPPDGPLSQWITGFVGKVPALDTMMRWADCDYIIPVIMALILLALWFGAKNKSQRDSNHRAIFYAISAVALASIIIELLNKTLDPWPRPYEVYESARFAMELIYQTSVDPSFPSNAAIVGFAIATGIWFGNRKAGVILFALAILWVFARLYGGSHYLVDIVGGAVIGISIAYFFKLYYSRIEPVLSSLLKLARKLYLA